mgnify:CR=1 FL=1|tara:strand:+ start:87 stop:479 length:393 start_codon:yes stop_codon:yes gene_type:complete
MKVFMTIIAVLVSASVLAAPNNTYQIKMSFSIEGKSDSTMSVAVEEGKMGSVVSENEKERTFFEVVATEGEIEGNKGILMKFKVGHLEKDGSRKIISHPIILAKAGEEALISVGQKGKPEMNLKVIATRK